MKDKRTTAALLAVLAVLTVILIITKLTSSGPGRNAPARVRPADEKAAKAGLPKTAIKVDLDLLGKHKDSFIASRNIFDPVYEAPSLSKLAGKGKKVTVKPLPPPPPPKTQAEIDIENARAELGRLKVMGFLKRKGREDVFFSLGQENYVAARGGIITKQYYLTDVSRDSLTVTDKKTGVSVRYNMNFSNAVASNIFPSPGFSGAGAAGGPPRYQPGRFGFPGPFGIRPPGPPANNGQPGNVQRPQGVIHVQPGNMQRKLPDPLTDLSTR